jgi:hypothetical protein
VADCAAHAVARGYDDAIYGGLTPDELRYIRARIGNYVEVKYLPGADLYDMEFFNISPQGKKTVKKFTRLYGDQLIPTFENHTAWYIRL